MYEFTEEDLKANKRGQLSSHQREWLKGVAGGVRRLSRTNVRIGIGFLFFGVCLMLTLYLQNERSRAAFLSDPMNLLVFPVMIVVVMGIFGFSLLFAKRQSEKLESPVLSSASGKVRFDEYTGKGGVTSYYVFVGKKRFTFGDDMSGILKEDGNYEFYYCRAGLYEFVMSYEEIGK